MPKFRDNKTKRLLKGLAANLPMTVYKAKVYFPDEAPDNLDHEAMNRQAALVGGHVEATAPEIVQRRTAIYERDQYYPINHFKRLKKAYLNGGWVGVSEYMEWVYKNNEKVNSEHDMKMTMMTAEQILKQKIQPLFG